MTELQSGVLLSHYELLVRIGRGGMASVWVARERSVVSGNQRLVAVKAMLPELARHSEFRSMFLSEVQIIQSIQHDNVVRVFEVSEDHGVLYMAMEWVEGDSLRNIIRASRAMGALPPEIAVCIAADAAAGLHAAHELRDWDGQLRGVVHCDVSPHNILVGLDGKAKLVDFGIASALERLQRPEAETIQGKISYMSPEQALGSRLDRRTDVFALGIVLYEMTMGEQLFRGRDAAHTLELVKRGKIPRPSLLNPSYPKKLEPIVLKALERDPAQRFQTAEELEYELSNYLIEEHAVVSHPIVAKLLWRLLGSRVEKRREVISAIVSSIDAHRPQGSIAERVSWLPDYPMNSDPLNFTATGLSESRLGLAARLEADGTVNIARSFLAAKHHVTRVPWGLIAGGVGLLCAATLGTYWYVAHSGVASSEAQAPDSGLPAAKTSAPSKPEASSGHSDGVLSIDSLPVASQREAAGKGEPARRAPIPVRRGEKSFDELVAEGAAAAARKGGIAKAESTAEASEQPESPANSPAGIDQTAARAALAAAAAAAKTCRGQGTPPSPQGHATVTFSPSGSVTAVSISQSYMGTALGSCIVSHYRNARVPEFEGGPTTLNSTFEIPE